MELGLIYNSFRHSVQGASHETPAALSASDYPTDSWAAYNLLMVPKNCQWSPLGIQSWYLFFHTDRKVHFRLSPSIAGTGFFKPSCTEADKRKPHAQERTMYLGTWRTRQKRRIQAIVGICTHIFWHTYGIIGELKKYYDSAKRASSSHAR